MGFNMETNELVHLSHLFMQINVICLPTSQIVISLLLLRCIASDKNRRFLFMEVTKNSWLFNRIFSIYTVCLPNLLEASCQSCEMEKMSTSYGWAFHRFYLIQRHVVAQNRD